jgi:Amiloride-sensitive sodium channel
MEQSDSRNSVKQSKSFAYQLDGKLKFKLLPKRKQQIIAKAAFCPRQYLFMSLPNVTNCNQCLTTIRDIKIPPEEIFFDCKFRNRAINCTESFREMLVGFKLCYTFNGLDLLRHQDGPRTDEWSIDGGYKSTAALDAYPHRAMRAGLKFGLSFLLRNDDDHFDPICSTLEGYIVIFPNESLN